MNQKYVEDRLKELRHQEKGMKRIAAINYLLGYADGKGWILNIKS